MPCRERSLLLIGASLVLFVFSVPWAGAEGLALTDSVDVSSVQHVVGPTCVRDAFSWNLVKHLLDTHLFLLRHKHGLPYAADPRPLEPFSEVIRLEVDTQALGYLNLYKLTRMRLWLTEAEDRLQYILNLGDAALRNSAVDGQVGYSFLVAYELTGHRPYLDYGLKVADRCLGSDNSIMNWGYMAAMNLGKAYALMGRQVYQTEARAITRRSAYVQFPGGAFPHGDKQVYGANAGYTAWMIFEMLQHRFDDPQDPDMDYGILRGTRFLAKRVNPDGSLNYEDQDGTYYADPGGRDARGWMNDVASMAYDLSTVGRDGEVSRLLAFLFQHESRGRDRGGYPDKWGYFDPTYVWAIGNPSIVRTSLIFWYLTAIPLIDHSCDNGAALPCSITPDDCNAAFRDMGLCNAGLHGFNTCINGVFTQCLAESLIRYDHESVCSTTRTGQYLADGWSQVEICDVIGNRKCIGQLCRPACDGEPTDTRCRDERVRGDACMTPGNSPTVPLSRPAARVSSVATLGLEPIHPNPGLGEFTVSFSLEGAEPARLEVLDTAGRRVLSREVGALGPGQHSANLNKGRTLPPGVYLVRLTQRGKAMIARVAVIR